MRTKRGMSMAELSVALGIMALTVFTVASMFIFGLRAMQKTTSDTNLNQTNAQAMRRITETLRGAMATTITNEGRMITYTLPKMSPSADSITGEKELIVPLQSDGVTRSFYVTTDGKLVDSVTGKTLIKNIRLKDPDPDSSQYNQNYAPFSTVTVGSQRGITINLITAEDVLGDLRFARLKTTVVTHNR